MAKAAMLTIKNMFFAMSFAFISSLPQTGLQPLLNKSFAQNTGNMLRKQHAISKLHSSNPRGEHFNKVKNRLAKH
jgi:hypothetical protein